MQTPLYPIGTTPMGHRPGPDSAQNSTSMNHPNPALRAYVLEDDADIAALEADLLREMGFSVVTCTRIVELGDLMDVALPHLLVIDVMLPDGDGGDITELLRSAWPGIPAVFVSAANRERLAELAPIGPVVAKPFDLDAFRNAVDEALAGARELRSAS
jgi:two-component system, OmpR family, phosphate regulon response regulator PhoB